MKKVIFSILLFSPFLLAAQQVKRLHRKAVVADTHNDVLSSAVLDGLNISYRLSEGHSDLPRFAEGGVDLQFFSVWTGDTPRTSAGFYKDAVQEIDSLYAIAARNPSRMAIALNYDEVKQALKQDQLVALVGVEGGHMIEDRMDLIDSLHVKGMRYLTLTWNNSTSWASSAKDETENNIDKPGLNEFGKNVVRRLNQLGIIVDLSHTGEKTFYDALEVTSKPVLLSHSSVWNICPVFRNLKDDQIKAVAANGGVICINFYSGFISKAYDEQGNILGARRNAFRDSLIASGADTLTARKTWSAYYRDQMKQVRPTLADMVDHIDYIVKLVGVEYVGLGADYDGVGSLPEGLDDVTAYPAITKELRRRGYSRKSVKKILGGNVLRVMKANMN